MNYSTIDQNECSSVAIGFDYVAQSLNLILERYLKFYSTPIRYIHKAQHHKRVKDMLRRNPLIPGLEIDLKFDITP